QALSRLRRAATARAGSAAYRPRSMSGLPLRAVSPSSPRPARVEGERRPRQQEDEEGVASTAIVLEMFLETSYHPISGYVGDSKVAQGTRRRQQRERPVRSRTARRFRRWLGHGR